MYISERGFQHGKQVCHLYNSERGVVFTMKKHLSGGAHIHSIPAIPFYDDYYNTIPGIKFGNPAIHFLSVDFDYQTQNLYLYDYYFK